MTTESSTDFKKQQTNTKFNVDGAYIVETDITLDNCDANNINRGTTFANTGVSKGSLAAEHELQANKDQLKREVKQQLKAGGGIDDDIQPGFVAQREEPEYRVANCDDTSTNNSGPGRSNHALREAQMDQQTLKVLQELDEKEFTPETRRKILFACLFSLCIGNMMIQNVAAFLPTFIAQNDWDQTTDYSLEPNDTSLIIAVFSIAQIIFSPFNALIKNTVGAKSTILLGFGLVTITTAGLGAIANVKKPLAFKYLAIFLRFFQGQGDVMLQITGYSVITQIFSDDIMKYIGYIEIACGIGLGLGPSIGSIVYGWLEYEKTMYFFAGLNVAAFFICLKYIPAELNQTVSLEEVAELEMFEEEEFTVDEKDHREENRKKISCCMLMTNKGAFFALMTMSVGVMNVTFNLGYMPTQVVALGFDENNVGYVFGVQSFFYLITCLLLPYTCEEAPRKLMFLSAVLGLTVCTFMLGPSDLLNINDNYWVVIAAYPIQGIFQTFVFIPIIPEMIERCKVSLNIVEGQDPILDGMLNDKINDAYGFFYAASMFLAPLVGSFLFTDTDARRTSTYIGYFNIAYMVILFICNCGPWVFSENKKFLKRLEALTPTFEQSQGTIEHMVMGSIYAKRTLNIKRTTSHGEMNFYGDAAPGGTKVNKKRLGRNFVYHDSDFDRKVKFISAIKAREDIALREKNINVKQYRSRSKDVTAFKQILDENGSFEAEERSTFLAHNSVIERGTAKLTMGEALE